MSWARAPKGIVQQRPCRQVEPESAADCGSDRLLSGLNRAPIIYIMSSNALIGPENIRLEPGLLPSEPSAFSSYL